MNIRRAEITSLHGSSHVVIFYVIIWRRCAIMRCAPLAVEVSFAVRMNNVSRVAGADVVAKPPSAAR